MNTLNALPVGSSRELQYAIARISLNSFRRKVEAIGGFSDGDQVEMDILMFSLRNARSYFTTAEIIELNMKEETL